MTDADQNRLVNGRSFGIALAIHLGLLLFFWGCSFVSDRPKELEIPIDLTVVVNENLDGKENEPPPTQNVKPPPPAPKVKAPPPPAPPKVDEHVDAIEKIPEKKKPEKKKVEEKKPEKKEPEKKVEEKKLTKEELRQKRLEEIRNRAKPTKKKVSLEVRNAPNGDGKTAKKTLTDAQIRKLLAEGYRPGATTQLASDENQRCISLIKKAFYDKWDRPPWTDTLRKMLLSVTFDMNGRVTGYRLVQSSGDGQADRTVTAAASRVLRVSGLSAEFLRQNRDGIIIEFKVTP